MSTVVLASEPAYEPGHGIFFEIMHGGKKQACFIDTTRYTAEEAKTKFHQSLQTILKQAFDCAENGVIENGEVKLVMIG